MCTPRAGRVPLPRRALGGHSNAILITGRGVDCPPTLPSLLSRTWKELDWLGMETADLVCVPCMLPILYGVEDILPITGGLITPY